MEVYPHQMAGAEDRRVEAAAAVEVYPHQMAGTEDMRVEAATAVGVYLHQMAGAEARRVEAAAAVELHGARLGSGWTSGCSLGRKPRKLVIWPDATSRWRTGCRGVILTCGRSSNVGTGRGGEVSTLHVWRSIPTLWRSIPTLEV